MLCLLSENPPQIFEHIRCKTCGFPDSYDLSSIVSVPRCIVVVVISFGRFPSSRILESAWDGLEARFHDICPDHFTNDAVYGLLLILIPRRLTFLSFILFVRVASRCCWSLVRNFAWLIDLFRGGSFCLHLLQPLQGFFHRFSQRCGVLLKVPVWFN